MKIKNNVDLKILKQFGFEEDCWAYYKKIKEFRSKTYFLVVDKHTNFVEVIYGNKSSPSYLLTPGIYINPKPYAKDLIEADLIVMDKLYYQVEFKVLGNPYEDEDNYELYSQAKLWNKDDVEKFIDGVTHEYDVISDSIVISQYNIHGNYCFGIWNYNLKTKQWVDYHL
ncbi:MAG: hypothetical protein J1F32_01605 [Erysipelotrichales bacterium]|nr:hypothetical protein [Erysipelotrichales bacterium]